MIINGKDIQAEIQQTLVGRIKNLSLTPTLCVLQLGDDPVTSRFVRMKQRFGESIGAVVDVVRLPEDCSFAQVLATVGQKNNDPKCHGIVVQLPLPSHIDAEAVCNAITPEKDIDALGSKSSYIAPVAGAVREILARAEADILDKRVVVVGAGRLVGQPVAKWFQEQGNKPDIVDIETPNPECRFKNADIIVSGAGVPHMIKPEMIKDGVVLIDAGTSEEGGELKGDIDPDCAKKASVFTPVPGGVGPITVAVLFKNLLEAAEE